MLYFAISVVINTTFFPTIQRYIDNGIAFSDTDSSLIEILFESLMGTEESAPVTNQEADDATDSVDFISFRSGWVLSNDYFVQTTELSTNQDFPENPTLEKFTPPPKS